MPGNVSYRALHRPWVTVWRMAPLTLAFSFTLEDETVPVTEELVAASLGAAVWQVACGNGILGVVWAFRVVCSRSGSQSLFLWGPRYLEPPGSWDPIGDAVSQLSCRHSPLSLPRDVVEHYRALPQSRVSLKSHANTRQPYKLNC